MASKPYQSVVASLLLKRPVGVVLDCPSGSGWLSRMVPWWEIHGIDLYGDRPDCYGYFTKADLNDGLPEDLGAYDAIVSCEGLEHLGNPLLFLASARTHLKPGGVLIVTTPNTWHPAARFQYSLRGFFPGFPAKPEFRKGEHLHVMPWSYPQLYLFFRLAGFGEITLHEVDEPKPKHLVERLMGLPQVLYCKRKAKRSDGLEAKFWAQAGSRQSVYGRRLVVSAEV